MVTLVVMPYLLCFPFSREGLEGCEGMLNLFLEDVCLFVCLSLLILLSFRFYSISMLCINHHMIYCT